MGKLIVISTGNQSEIKRIQNRKIMDIVEYDEFSKNLGGYHFKQWVGSTETEYFSILFVKGLLNVCVEERESDLGKNPINYAISKRLVDKMSIVKNDLSKVMEESEKYNNVGYYEDHKEVHLKEVLKVLKWKRFSRNVKVKKGYLFDL